MKKGGIKRAIGKIIFMSLLLFLGLGANSFNASASSAQVSVESSSGQVTKGDIVYVIITVNSSDAMSGFEGYFSYDSRILQYISGGSVISGNDNGFQLSDTGRESGVNTLKYSVKFVARKTGATSIELRQPYAVYSSEDSSKMSVSSNTLNIMVKKKKADNAPTKNTAKPGKKPENREDGREISNPEDTMKPQESGVPKQQAAESASPEPTASKKPKKKTYDEKKVKGADDSVTASYQNGVTTIHFYDEYKVTEVKDKKDIPIGFGETEIVLSGHVITAYATEGDTEHTYVLMYCKRGREDAQFYLYDTKSDSFMPYEKVKAWYKGAVGNAVVGSDSMYETKIKTMKYIVAIMVIICLLMLIGMLTIYLHYRENNNIIYRNDDILESDREADGNDDMINAEKAAEYEQYGGNVGKTAEHEVFDGNLENENTLEDSFIEKSDSHITHYWKRD